MLNLIVTGSAGRMGRRLVANIAEQDDLCLVGATEIPESGFIGQDAGTVAGVRELGVKILPDMEDAVKKADVIIDFTTAGVLEHTALAVKNNAAIVIGTTALTAGQREELDKLAKAGARIVQTTNYSLGVNLLFHLSKLAARVLPGDFDIEIVEAHHNKKKDSPSGTAETLAEILCEERGFVYDEAMRFGRQGVVGARTRGEIGMHSIRGGDIVGDHTVLFASEGERVELTHKASSRDTFARGAIRAARFAAAAPGGKLYNMQDVLAELLEKARS